MLISPLCSPLKAAVLLPFPGRVRNSVTGWTHPFAPVHLVPVTLLSPPCRLTVLASILVRSLWPQMTIGSPITRLPPSRIVLIQETTPSLPPGAVAKLSIK